LRLRALRQARFGALQGDQCRLDVAGEFVLLRGDGEVLLDLRQQAVVAHARPFLVHRLQRELLTLHLGLIRFQRADLRLQRIERLAVLPGIRLRLGLHCIAVGQATGQFLAGGFDARVALPRQPGQRPHAQQGQHRQPDRQRPRRAGRCLLVGRRRGRSQRGGLECLVFVHGREK